MIAKHGKLNVKLIKSTIAHIEAEIKRLWMPTWGHKKNALYIDAPPSYAACKTACCFYGWGKILSTPREKREDLFDADGALDINVSEMTKKFGFDPTTEASSVYGAGTGRDPNSGKFLTRSRQLKELRAVLNKIFVDRGLKVRV